jgi:hypothetical protein
MNSWQFLLMSAETENHFQQEQNMNSVEWPDKARDGAFRKGDAV